MASLWSLKLGTVNIDSMLGKCWKKAFSKTKSSLLLSTVVTAFRAFENLLRLYRRAPNGLCGTLG